MTLYDEILADSPAAFWIMNESSGTTFADSSGNGMDLTISGSPALHTSDVMVDPDSDLVWNPELEGADYAYRESGGDLNLVPGAFAFLCWFCGSSTSSGNPSYETLLSFDPNEGSAVRMEILVVDYAGSMGLEPGTLRVRYNGYTLQTTIESQNNVNLLDGSPHMVYVYYDSYEMKIYIDGVLSASQANIGWLSGTSGTTYYYLGRNSTNDSNYGLNNPMGYVAMWFYGQGPNAARLQDYLAFSQGETINEEIIGTGEITADRDLWVINHVVTATIEDTINIIPESSFFEIARSQVWWNKNYTYRRIINVEATPTGLEQDHPILSELSRNLIQQNKVRQDGSDIEVLRLANRVPEQWALLDKTVDIQNDKIDVTWNNVYDIPANTTVADTYFIYYGNHNLTDAPEVPATPTYQMHEWPISLPYNDQAINYTRPDEDWLQNIATEPLAKATLYFYGSKVRILADTGPNWGIAEVQIDFGEWETVDLYANQETLDRVVFTKEDLSKGMHKIRYRVSGRKNPSATDTAINFTHIEYAKWGVGLDLGEEADETLMWSSALGGTIGG